MTQRYLLTSDLRAIVRLAERLISVGGSVLFHVTMARHLIGRCGSRSHLEQLRWLLDESKFYDH